MVVMEVYWDQGITPVQVAVPVVSPAGDPQTG